MRIAGGRKSHDAGVTPDAASQPRATGHSHALRAHLHATNCTDLESYGSAFYLYIPSLSRSEVPKTVPTNSGQGGRPKPTSAFTL